MPRDWEGKTVVITGASAGLGRAAAVAFARRGAVLVLGARRADALEETARQCRDAGGRAIAVPTDVTREEQVCALADAALAESGCIDVWVNNAGVTAFAPIEEGPFAEHRRVLETNLHGAIFGARAVVPIFRRQQRGVLINVGSLLSQMGHAFVPAYAISKFGMRGLSEALRVELADEPDIHVCTIMPYAIDTQHFEAAASRVGREARAMPPTQAPESVAEALVALAARPRRQRYVPRAAALGLALHALFPRTVERLLLHALQTWHFTPVREPVKAGNLFQPTREPAAVHGQRGPRLGVLRFALWALGDLLRGRERSGRRLAPQPAPHGSAEAQPATRDP
jgi:short-subunit dehydrogenase